MWLGRPGSLVALPDLQPDIAVAEDRGTVIHSSVSGGITLQNMYRDTKREYRVPYNYLADQDIADLLAFRHGHYGPGPFVLLTELDCNLLEANQSSGTDQRTTTYGFSASLGTLTSVVGGYKGLRQLNWQLPASGATPNVKLTWKGNAAGLPAVPQADYAFSVWLKANTTTNMRLRLSYRNAANSEIGYTEWSTVAITTAWSRIDVAGESIDGTVYVLPIINLISATASQLISIDSAQLEFGQAATSWQPGLGIPYVSISDLPREYAMSGYQNPGAVKFVEVG